VRHYTSYSAQGTTSDTWNGKNSAGAFVSDGRFDITITPRIAPGTSARQDAQREGQ